MYEILLIVLVVIAICLIGLVMLQQGKGATMGASFGAGASNTLFGSSGASNFMTRMTAVFATIFFIICLALGNLATRETSGSSDKWQNLGSNAPVVQPAKLNTKVVPNDEAKQQPQKSPSGVDSIPE